MKIINIFNTQGNLHVHQEITGAQSSAGDGDNWLGLVLGAGAAFGMLSLLAMLVIHLVEMVVTWVTVHATEILISIALITTGMVLLARWMHRKNARLPEQQPSSTPVPMKATEQQASATAQITGSMQRQLPSREIETVYFVETPLTIKRNE